MFAHPQSRSIYKKGRLLFFKLFVIDVVLVIIIIMIIIIIIICLYFNISHDIIFIK